MAVTKRGGARPGAGRKKKALVLLPASPKDQTPLQFLLAMMQDQAVDLKLRVEAARAAMPFVHVKVGDVGKKDEATGAAKIAARGKFAPGVPPKLASVKQFPPR